jgi:serralysin
MSPKNESQWCFAWHAGVAKPHLKTRAALVREYAWDPNETIEISFLDGETSVQERVKAAAGGWLGPELAGLQFAFRNDTTDTPIRISFSYRGSWSVIGTTCKQIPKNQPTMNFGWLKPDSTDDEVRRVVLHEFGHALGLIHEHQNPLGEPIQWDRDAVSADLSGPPNNWDQGTIDHNMFEPYEKSKVAGTDLDPKSIMMYPIPASWTLDGFSVGLNSTLSEKDKSFIHEQYP